MIAEKTLQDHIKDIDHLLGDKLSKLYSNTFNYQVILDHFFGVNKEVGKLRLSTSNKFITQLINLIKNEYIEFDEYLIILLAIVRQIPVKINHNVTTEEFELKENIFISKGVDKNHFVYNNFKNVQITFSLVSKPSKKHLDRDYVIQFENIKPLPNRLKRNVFYKSFSSYYFYILSLLLLTIILLWKIPALSNIIEFINTQLQNKFDSKFSCYLFAGVAIIVAIPLVYKPYIIVRRIIKWVSSRHEYSIEKKYSNIERYKEVVSSDKFLTLRPFEGDEQPITIESEDIIGFNLLRSLFYYNYISYNFSPIVNRIIILDGVRGVGKTSFLNLLKNKIHGYEKSNCKTFKQYISGGYINLVQLSLMPLIASTGDVDLRKVLQYLADNLYGDESLYLRRLLSVFNSNNKLNLENIKETLGINDNILQLRKHIKRSEQKNIIIIEDIDRLDDNKLREAVKFLWFIYELPFTITILPGDDARIRKAINFANSESQNTDEAVEYNELEEFKLLQASFSLKEHVYKALANYSVALFSSDIEKLDVKSSHQQLAEIISFLRNDKLPEISRDQIAEFMGNQGFSNEWTSHVISRLSERGPSRDVLIAELTELVYRSFADDNKVKRAIFSDIVQLLKTYTVSIREMKWIILHINSSRGNLFLVQQIVFYIIYYRYKDTARVMDYLKNYSQSGDFLERRDLRYPFVNDDLIVKSRNLIPNYIHDLVNNLEQYPVSIEHDGMGAFINQLFSFYNAASKTKVYNYNNTSRRVFRSEFIRFFLADDSTSTSQQVYDKLSKNWKLGIEHLDSYRPEFILAFNVIAERRVERESKKISYNLFLYQNMAILLLYLIKANNDFISTIQEYMEGDKLYNHAICLEVKIFGGKIVFEIPYLIEYYQTLFNITATDFSYDDSHLELTANYQRLKNLLLKSKVSDEFASILRRIFNEPLQ